MTLPGKRDNLDEGPEPRDNTVCMGSWQPFRLVGLWPLGGVSGDQITKGLRSWTEESRFSQEHCGF